ncbi:unnamed protein product [Discosporangium mesarthrocarpum]
MLEVCQADYENTTQAADVVRLLDIYARDPMGGGTPLSEDTKTRLIPAMAARQGAFSVLVYVDGQAAALANCFEGFSTFKAKILVNIHDVMVHPDYRGRKLSTRLLEKVEEIAKARGACKLTLEVLSKNEPAKASYQKFGFTAYELDPETGTALFWEKTISC